MGTAINKVLYNIDQRADTTDSEKARARANIGAPSSSEVPFTYRQQFTGSVVLNSDDISNWCFDIDFQFDNAVKTSDKDFFVALDVHIDEAHSGYISAPDGTPLTVALETTISGGAHALQGESSALYTNLGNTHAGRSNFVLLYRMANLFNSGTHTLSFRFPPNTFQVGDTVSYSVNAYLVSERDLSI